MKLEWHELKSKELRWLLRHFYYSLRPFIYYQKFDKYVAWIDKRELGWERALEYILDYCKKKNIKVVMKEERDTIFLEFQMQHYTIRDNSGGRT